MNNVPVILIAIALVLSSKLYAGNNQKKSFKACLEYYEEGDYLTAKNALLIHHKLYPHDYPAIYYIGLCNLLLGDYQNALKKIQEYYNSDRDHLVDLEDLYYLAYLNHLNHNLDQALSKYSLLLTKMKGEEVEYLYLNDLQQEISKADVKSQIAKSRYAKKQIANPVEVQIETLSAAVNSAWPEFAPVISADQNTLVFTSRRPACIGDIAEDGLHNEDLFVTHRQADGAWGEAVLLDTNRIINSIDHDASVALSSSGDRLIIYRSTFSLLGQASGDLYFSNRVEGEWSELVPFSSTINTKYWEASASLTADGKTMVFTSDKPGGIGGVDIYVSTMDGKGDWTEAENLGKSINTKQDEDAPYINADASVLNFASKGHENMGGFDIFTSKHDPTSNTWSKAENMGYPINTCANDVHFAWSPDGSVGYFASARSDSRGFTDIYTLTLPESRFNFISLRGKVLDSETNRSLKVTIEIYDNDKHELIERKVTDGTTGEYNFTLPPGKNYGIFFSKKGYLFKSRNFYQPDQFQYIDQNEDIYLEKIEHEGGEVLNNTFFDSADNYQSNLSFYDLVALKKLVKQNPNFRTKMLLIYSCKPNDTVKVRSVLEKNIIDIQGALVRLKLVKNVEVVPIIKTAAESKRKNQYYLYDKEVEDKELEDLEIVEEDTLSNLIDTKVLEKKVVEEGEILIKEVVHFEHNTGGRQDREFLIILSKVRFFLTKYPHLIIEVAGYTDSKGSENYNLRLSKSRADFVRQHLITSGIEANRLISIGHGEKNPVGSNDTEEGRRQNRRVEFKVASK